MGFESLTLHAHLYAPLKGRPCVVQSLSVGDGHLEHAQVDAMIEIGARHEDLCALDHGEPMYAFPHEFWLWGEREDRTECFEWIIETKLLVYLNLRVACARGCCRR